MWTLVLFFGSPQNSSVGTAAVLVPIFVQFTTLTPRCLFLLSLFFSVNVLGQSPFGHPGAKMSERWLTQYINKMWSRGLGHIPSCQQRSPHNVLHSQCLDASCQRLHPVGIEPVTSCHASLTRLHILLMYWVIFILSWFVNLGFTTNTHVLLTKPSSRTFWLMDLAATSVILRSNHTLWSLWKSLISAFKPDLQL